MTKLRLKSWQKFKRVREGRHRLERVQQSRVQFEVVVVAREVVVQLRLLTRGEEGPLSAWWFLGWLGVVLGGVVCLVLCLVALATHSFAWCCLMQLEIAQCYLH